MHLLTRKRAAALGAIIAVAIAGAAYAFWTGGGSGTGSASAAQAQTALTVNQTSQITSMYPGDSPQTISGDFTNPNQGPIRVGTVTVGIASVTKAAGAPAGTCDATDFTLANTDMAVNADVPAGTHVGSFTGATIRFNSKPSSQDACKGASVTLAYSIA